MHGGNMEKNMNVPEQKASQGGTRLLLVVDGNVSRSFCTSILLQRLEYNIYAVKTAEDAPELIGMTAPSLVFSRTMT